MKISDNNLHIIIQGPLLSIGKTARDIETDKVHAEAIMFDCEQNILEQIHEIKKYLPNASISVVITDDNTLNSYVDVEVLHDSYQFSGCEDQKNKNKYRQFSSTLAGIIDQKSHTMKIRTDMAFDWKNISQLMQNQNFEDYIYVNFLHTNFIEVPDFVFLGKTQRIKDFCNSMVNYKYDFLDNVHTDMTVKYIFQFYRKIVNISDIAYFVRVHGKANQLNRHIFNFAFENVYHALPFGFHPITWRGDSFPSDYLQRIKDEFIWDAKKNFHDTDIAYQRPKYNFARYLLHSKWINRNLFILISILKRKFKKS